MQTKESFRYTYRYTANVDNVLIEYFGALLFVQIFDERPDTALIVEHLGHTVSIAVVNEREAYTCIEERLLTQSCADYFGIKLNGFENRVVGPECDRQTVLCRGTHFRKRFGQLALFKFYGIFDSVAAVDRNKPF